MNYNGLYIAFEGIDGCGKSTQAHLLADALGALHTREPGGSSLGVAIREVVLHGPDDIGARAEVLLFAADRAHHIDTVVAPELAAGRHVVSDRSVWSSVVYQGIGRGVGVEDVLEVNTFACRGVYPDIVVYLRSSVDIMRGRIEREKDRIEMGDDSFFHRLGAGFDALAVEQGWIVVEPGSVEDVHRYVLERVQHAVQRRGEIIAQDSAAPTGDDNVE